MGVGPKKSGGWVTLGLGFSLESVTEQQGRRLRVCRGNRMRSQARMRREV